MPRQSKGPRLSPKYPSAGKGKPTWIIRDGTIERSTGASLDDLETAEKKLAEYIAKKHTSTTTERDPAKVLIADVLSEYSEFHAPTTKSCDKTDIAVEHLLAFDGWKSDSGQFIKPWVYVADIRKSVCQAYTAWRIAKGDSRIKDPEKRKLKPAKAATARRELVVLQAAINYCFEDGKLDRPIPVWLPQDSSPRQRYLQRSEVARLVAGALGFWLITWTDVATRKQHWQVGGRIPERINRHVALFILIGFYTGTRHDAILRLQWASNTTGGWIELHSGTLYRRGEEQQESSKRRPATPLPPPLAGHLWRFKRRTNSRWVINYGGEEIAGQLRRSWDGAREMALLGADVTPHILRHTCATLLLQGKASSRGGVALSCWQVAEVLGTTEEVIRRTYGHHAQDHTRKAVADAWRRA
jgi:integrase